MCDYNISVDKVVSQNTTKTLLRYKESKDRQHISAFFFDKAIIRSRPDDSLIEKKGRNMLSIF